MPDARDPIRYEGDRLTVEGVPVEDLARAAGTPCYVYSGAAIRGRLAHLRRAFEGLDARIRYAVKANPNGALLRLIAGEGAGFDLVSGWEFLRALAAGGDPAAMVFAGAGKLDWELELALEAGLGLFVVESERELERLAALAKQRDCRAPVALRLNPGVAAGGHDYIHTARPGDKFGLPPEAAERAIRFLERTPELRLVALHVHLGSLVLDPAPYLAAARKVLDTFDGPALRRLGLRFYDMGGGFGVRGPFEPPLDVEELGRGMRELLAPRDLGLLLEPGRFVVGDAGLLVTAVLERKETPERAFVIVDAGMNDLIRPALYGAEHPIVPVRSDLGPELPPADVVGPICESGDVLGRDRRLPALPRGSLLAVLSAGAYGASMASRYNSRPLCAEVLVDGGAAVIVGRREDLEALRARDLSEGLDLGRAAGDPPWRRWLDAIRKEGPCE